jgi:hypothetical protein
MISRSFIMIGVSESCLRKLLPEYLKSTKHTSKDYLELQQQRDQQTLQQQQRQQELAELTSSSTSTRHPALEQQQPSDDYDEQTARMRNYGNNVVVKPHRSIQTPRRLENNTSLLTRDKRLSNLWIDLMQSSSNLQIVFEF